MTVTTRFAPSPTGYLHLGHGLSARVGWDVARAVGGRFLLRIEDIDTTRCRPVFDTALREDLAWLGLDWDGPVIRQSDRFDAYRAAADRLRAPGLLYPCFCSRKDIADALAAAGGDPAPGPDGPRYPGTCRRLDPGAVRDRLAAGVAHTWRLNMAAATARAGPLTWTDHAAGTQVARPEAHGDVVLVRRDVPTSYHLAVTIDDAWQGVTHVTRGRDLFAATDVHRLLQALLDLPVPHYHHHALIAGPDGRRLAKRANSAAIRTLRDAGESPEAVWSRLDYAPPGVSGPAGARPCPQSEKR